MIRFRAGVAAVAVALLIWLGGRWAGPRMLGVMVDVRQWGLVAPVAFMLLYAVAVVALVPASVLTMAGGAVFGLVRGVAFSFGGALLGSTVAFLLGRYVARRVIERKLATMPRFAAIDRAVSAQGRRIVFLLRLSPIVPFNFLNYALGVTRISIKDFAIASAGMLPGAVMYAYAGKVTGEALALAGQAELPKNSSYYAILVAGLAATLAATTVITRTARRALRDV
ncbi:MAG TPA: TVP38/TMEM64 family protein [Vicinamibacterales bacterium]|nr:TVP38/TMEM64 family protein [Vicinamibacterales bacterium]